MHLIRQHSFDIQCSSQDFGKEIHSQLGSLLEKEFYPQLENLFNRYDIKNHTLSIEILKIELPAISKKHWKEELINNSLNQIEDFLKRNQLEKSVPKLDAKVDLLSSSKHAEYIFFEFLKSGNSIENSLTKDLKVLVSEIEITNTFIDELIIIFNKNKEYLLRWIFSAPDFFNDRVLQKLDNFPNEIFNLLNSMLTINLAQNVFADKIVKKQWIEFVQWMTYLQKKSVFRENDLKEFIRLSEELWDFTNQELEIVCKNCVEKTIPSSDSNTNDFSEFFSQVQKFIRPNNFQESNFQTVEHSGQEISILDSNSRKNDNEFINVHYITNAGLVILYPFLKALFIQLDFCNADGSWLTKIKQNKAILVLHYLVKSTDIIVESDLLLNKILCGFPLNGVVNVKLKLTKKEKEKCKNLLDAVKEHWKVMKSSSNEALQETFLQREGKLALKSKRESELWIEEKGVDILLDQLPWGISTIQTPWMVDYLTCNWK